MTDIRQRKQDHIDLALQPAHQGQIDGQFDELCFEPIAVPELDYAEIDLNTSFLSYPCSAPIIIGAMTGGCENGETINRHLAEAAEESRIPMALGSQRAALELALSQPIRQWAPTATLLGNLGATQLAQGGVDLAQAAVESIAANALVIHLNPLQELAQPNGDRDWRGILAAIEACCLRLDVPLIVKEVGAGIGPATAQRLTNAGVQWIEVAGRGGTNWASIELARNPSARDAEIMRPFINWGMRSIDLLTQLHALDTNINLIGSGGVRHGLDVARCLRLGAKMVALAQPFLPAAMQSTDAVIDKIDIIKEQLQRTMLLTGSINLRALSSAAIISTAR
ncbi:MAG: type 2 isopentenyl-diphosphate Delta-isomerase [Porticoccaceae bacterium]|nr:type 2 isopentenyl-diphosphate Delta-isomerase [Porticoccaceae bacterium]